MRLIDADAFTEQIAAAVLKKGTGEAAELGTNIIRLVDAQPTAYNVEKVEKRLEEKNRNVPQEVVRMVEKSILLQVLDQLWKEHIATLDMMRHTIVLRAYGQKDPLNEYKKEAFNMFSSLLDLLKERTTVVICRAVIQHNAEQTLQKAQERQQNIKLNENRNDGQDFDTNNKESDSPDPKTWGKVSRNDLCPCGSGKKFKHCFVRRVCGTRYLSSA